jgi:hypothetical protein
MLTGERKRSAPRRTLFVCLAALVLSFTSSAQKAGDFSGIWKMDASRSESAHQAVPIGPVTLAIKNTAADISIETRRADSNKSRPRSETLTYRVDGSETTTPGPDGAPIKCRAHWEGAQLVTGTTRNIQDSTITTLHVLSLDPSGRELTIHKTLTVQHGYQFPGAQNSGSGTDVFIRSR